MVIEDISKGYICIHLKNSCKYYIKDLSCYKRLMEYINNKKTNNNNYIFIDEQITNE